MAKVIGFDESILKKFICYSCGAIVQYSPNEDKFTATTKEGTSIKGLHCPNCGSFHRTNP